MKKIKKTIYLSKTFDCVNHGVLQDKIQALRDFFSICLVCLECYFSRRNQFIQVLSVVSKITPIVKGLPQGAILSLFSPWSMSVSSERVVQYANGTTLCFKAECPSALESNSWCSQFYQFQGINLDTWVDIEQSH